MLPVYFIAGNGRRSFGSGTRRVRDRWLEAADGP